MIDLRHRPHPLHLATLVALAVLVSAGLLVSSAGGKAHTFHCLGHVATVVGTNGDNDHLNGTSKADVIVGRGGTDSIDGKGGPDLICAGGGNAGGHGGRAHDR